MGNHELTEIKAGLRRLQAIPQREQKTDRIVGLTAQGKLEPGVVCQMVLPEGHVVKANIAIMPFMFKGVELKLSFTTTDDENGYFLSVKKSVLEYTQKHVCKGTTIFSVDCMSVETDPKIEAALGDVQLLITLTQLFGNKVQQRRNLSET